MSDDDRNPDDGSIPPMVPPRRPPVRNPRSLEEMAALVVSMSDRCLDMYQMIGSLSREVSSLRREIRDLRSDVKSEEREVRQTLKSLPEQAAKMAEDTGRFQVADLERRLAEKKADAVDVRWREWRVGVIALVIFVAERVIEGILKGHP